MSSGPAPGLLSPDLEISVLDPNGIAYLFGSLWVTQDNRGLLRRIDPKKGRIVATIKEMPFRGGTPVGAFGQVWVAEPVYGLAAVDPATNTITFTSEGAYSTMAPAAGFLWLDADNVVYKYDVEDGFFLAEVGLGAAAHRPEGDRNVLSVVEGSLWVGRGDDSRLFRIDPRRERVIAEIPQAGYRATVLKVGGRVVVFASDGRIRVIDPKTNRLTETVTFAEPLAFGVWSVVEGEGRLWVNWGHLVYALDPDTLAVLGVYDVGGTTWGIAYVDGALWIPLGDDDVVRKFGAPPAGA